MTNTRKLKGRIVERGYNLSSFATAMGLSRPALRKRINGQCDFKSSEIEKACSILAIQRTDVTTYFFTNKVPEMETSE